MPSCPPTTPPNRPSLANDNASPGACPPAPSAATGPSGPPIIAATEPAGAVPPTVLAPWPDRLPVLPEEIVLVRTWLGDLVGILTAEQIEQEVRRTDAIVHVSEQIVRNADLQLKAVAILANHGDRFRHGLTMIEGPKE